MTACITRAEARQLVGHCSITVNGKVLSIPSALVKAGDVVGVTDRAIIVERGSIVYQGESAALKADQKLLETYVGVADTTAVSRKAQRDARRAASASDAGSGSSPKSI